MVAPVFESTNNLQPFETIPALHTKQSLERQY